MVGRPPKPAALKRLAGNPGKRKIREEPKVLILARVPYPPRMLNKHGKKEWHRVIKLLIKAGLYSELDMTILTIYCAEYGAWKEALEEIENSGGKVLVTDKGYQYMNPWVTIANNARAAMDKAITQFGMSPGSRSKVSASKNEKEKSLAELLFEKVSENDK